MDSMRLKVNIRMKFELINKGAKDIRHTRVRFNFLRELRVSGVHRIIQDRTHDKSLDIPAKKYLQDYTKNTPNAFVSMIMI